MSLRVAVAGGGAWGTALGALAAQPGMPVLLWAREASVVAEINGAHRNSAFLPGVDLPASLGATADIAALAEADAILLVPPAQHMRGVLGALAPALRPGTDLIICAKGIERGSRSLMSEVVSAVAPGLPVGVLSGPSFAGEVARGMPTAVTLALADPSRGPALIARLGRPTFRPYLSDDVVGAQIGGALKNVLAIACGIVEGRCLGQSARAALVSRGFAEMTRFALKRGARAETLAGLSGLGDLILTCTSAQSRNYALGMALGRGAPIHLLDEGRSSIAEGAFTAQALVELAQGLGVAMPIAQAVDQILRGALSVDGAIEALLTRPFTVEN